MAVELKTGITPTSTYEFNESRLDKIVMAEKPNIPAQSSLSFRRRWPSVRSRRALSLMNPSASR